MSERREAEGPSEEMLEETISKAVEIGRARVTSGALTSYHSTIVNKFGEGQQTRRADSCGWNDAPHVNDHTLVCRQHCRCAK